MQAIEARVRAWLVWLAPFAAVLLLLGWETDWGRELRHVPPANAVVQPQPVAVALMPEFKLEGAPDARRETIDRTLFNPTRRPAPPAPIVAAQAAAMPRGTFTLTGTTVTDGKATALLREVNGGKVRRVQKGETVNGMLVEEVRPDRVKLSMNGDSEELTMRVAAGPKTTIQPVPPPAQPGSPNAPPPQPGQPGQPVAQAPQPPVVQDVAEVLAQRRRAARAAEAAAQQRDAGAAPPAPAAPVPAPPPGTSPAAVAPQSQAPKTDPGWNAVYQRYMQPRGGQ
jgi:hypothetical protein